jgi:exodeoxyribonuclease VII small subunit
MEPRFEDAVQRLEAIVEELERPGIALDRSLELFAEGITHLREATEALGRAEESVKVLVAKAGGVLQVTEFTGG